jgi:two-component system, chemotaxis family, response regulator WspF
MRIAIVNDLAIAREILRRLIASVPGYTIAWTAENGAEAVRLAAADRPDAILMDLLMPVMDGVEATRRIMAQSPCPILLVTSSVTGNYDRVYEAMGCGGLDAVNTPKLGAGGTLLEGDAILVRLAKLQRAKGFTAAAPGLAPSIHSGVSGTRLGKPSMLVIGASTGGPEALVRVLSGLPKNFPAPIVLIQHIAAEYAANLAQWLQSQSGLPVQVAKPGDAPMPSRVYLSASDDHLVLRADSTFAYVAEPTDYPYRPSVNVFFESLIRHGPARGVAVLLTGMGTDGAQGLLRLRTHGWHTLAQDEASCVVYGMPKAAKDLNAAASVAPLTDIAAQIRAAFAV